MLGILIIFILVLYGSYWCSRKVSKLSFQGRQSGYMKVLDRLVLGQDGYVTIIQVGMRYFLVSTSKEKTTFLAELKEEDLEALPAPDRGMSPEFSFKEILKKAGRSKDTEP